MRDTLSIVRSLGGLSRKWLRPGYPFRERALRRLERSSGLPAPMGRALLEALFSELTETRLKALLRSEIGDARILERFVRDERSGRYLRARGPSRMLHVLSANIPNAAVQSLVIGLLLKSENLLKVSSRDSGILPEYLASLRAHDKALARRCRVVRSVAGLIRSCDGVAVYGTDRTVEEIRGQCSSKARFMGYGHRVSFSLVARGAMNLSDARSLVQRIAHDVWMADQRGCLSPATVFVEEGGSLTPYDLARRLADALEKLSRKGAVRSRPPALHAEKIRAQQQHHFARMKGRESHFWKSPAGHWAVSYSREVSLEPSLGGQTVHVRSFRDAAGLFRTLAKHRDHLQAASLACPAGERLAWAEKLSFIGVNRITRPGRLQRPPVTWHHDGSPNLAHWLSWTDFEARAV